MDDYRECVMRRLLGSVLGLSIGFSAAAALADDLVGTVEKLDPNSSSIWIGGVSYQVEGQSEPLKFADIKVGDKVHITFDRAGTGNVASSVAPAK